LRETIYKDSKPILLRSRQQTTALFGWKNYFINNDV